MMTILKEHWLNRRIRMLLTIVIAIVFLISIGFGGFLLEEGRIATNLQREKCLLHL